MNIRELIGPESHGEALRSGDVIAIAMPMLEALNGLHIEGHVASLANHKALKMVEGRLELDYEHTSAPVRGDKKLFRKPKNRSSVTVVNELRETHAEDAPSAWQNVLVQTEGEELDAPRYLIGYRSWDEVQGYHDPLTDIFHCGLLLASLSFNLDFSEREDLERFVNHRDNLFALDNRVQPALVSVIVECTELYREDRPRTLEEVISRLKNFRRFDPDDYVDLTQTQGFLSQDVSARDNWILAKLKSRLFDLSRRNKLLYFKETASFLNLTVASVPPLLDHKNIKASSLITWRQDIQEKLTGKKKLALTNYLDIVERSYLPARLDKIRSEARKSRNEYGMNSLRLVIAFLRWTNVAEDDTEKINSPLLLLPVELVRRKGVKEQYVLQCDTSEAEVNPVLVHYLDELYGLQLPAAVDLEQSSVHALMESITAQIEASGSEIRLELVDKPRIELVHAAARRAHAKTLSRRRSTVGALNPGSYSYSYNEEEFTPLGLQIFQQKVRPAASTLEYIINDDIRPSQDFAKEQGKRSFYNTVEEGSGNPYAWEIDLCNVVLGNFNARAMSLVRDYDHIIEDNQHNQVFELLFSDQPRALDIDTKQTLGLKDRFPIIDADPTQTRAIEQAAGGDSYIIQGPPGTGKSQTITNLVAHYLGSDKRVLFVTEKRAALDVVYHRLKQRDLEDVCCRVHDSQSDKKAFILNLKETYESFINDNTDALTVASHREAVIAEMDEHLDRLSNFHERMRSLDSNAGTSVHTLFDKLISPGDAALPEPDALSLERIPVHAHWLEVQECVVELEKLQREQGFGQVLSEHPLIGVSAPLLEAEHPLGAVNALIEQVRDTWESISERLDTLDLPPGITELGSLSELLEAAQHLAPVARLEQLDVFRQGTQTAKACDAALAALDDLHGELERARADNAPWQDKLDERDARNAAEQWQQVNRGIFRFFKGQYRAIKRLVNARYDFKARDLRPEIATVLEELCQEYTLAEQVATARSELQAEFGITEDEESRALIRTLRGRKPPEHYQNALSCDADDLLELEDIAHAFAEMAGKLEQLRRRYARIAITDVEQWLHNATGALGGFSALIPWLRQLRAAPDDIQNLLESPNMGSGAMAYLTAFRSLTDIYNDDRQFNKTDGLLILHSVRQINSLHDQYHDANVAALRAGVREKFRSRVKHSETSVTGMSPEERETKKLWTAGRRILENEFGKSMRYKSIRELIARESRDVLMALKPIWLMSPQSVSDILPLNEHLFDVVIYDEASQITLEEGVPSLFRASQTIIVGDEMQMPPTNFFSTNEGDTDEEEQAIEDHIGIALDADSLLSQGVRKLPGVMLGWHYRSRHEALISFSNAAFYNRKLLTIPDQQLPRDAAQAVVADSSEHALRNLHALHDRPISFHYLQHGVYKDRANIPEADYIALLVRALIGTGNSLGVVAFSIQQQGVIEEALLRLAAKDKDFEAALEEEYQRVEDDQFVGLFIKNLENVQGDERDIIIMSVCYGHNANGRMLMNFGPINRRGGEKRLNVLFSRAKKHMAVVSSITAVDIKNEYNEGANYLRRFLLYAERLSAGELEGAATVLDSLSDYSSEHRIRELPAMAVQIAEMLQAEGYSVDTRVGRSYFRCDLAVRSEDGRSYCLGILLDSELHYRNTNVLEQYCQRPELLRLFGWKIAVVYAKDWFHHRARVTERLLKLLAGETDEADSADSDPVVIELGEQLTEPANHSVAPEAPQGSDEPVVENAPAAEGFERYELRAGTSSKFWEIKTEGDSYLVRYGRIGSEGRTLTKTFDDADTARAEMKKIISKKIAKGYCKVAD